jgi:hypothetical protein
VINAQNRVFLSTFYDFLTGKALEVFSRIDGEGVGECDGRGLILRHGGWMNGWMDGYKQRSKYNC